jgi:uncharacterized membrane protein YbhN (UPF0104 family)
MKTFSKYFVYISLIFLLFVLNKKGFLNVPLIQSITFIILSFLLLFLGFLFNVLHWHIILRKSGFPVRFKESLVSTGLTIFGKYIPGKIWIIIGRSAYLTHMKNYPLSQVSIVTLYSQLISLWVGLLFGMAGIFIVGGWKIWGWLSLILWILLTMVVYSPYLLKFVNKIIFLILKKKINIIPLKSNVIFSMLPWFCLPWLFWAGAFLLFIKSIISTNVTAGIGLGFPLSGTLGIMAIIAPGGLGVREATMTGFLNLSSISLKEAISITLGARLWFLVGEVFIFLLAFLMKSFIKNQVEK